MAVESVNRTTAASIEDDLGDEFDDLLDQFQSPLPSQPPLTQHDASLSTHHINNTLPAGRDQGTKADGLSDQDDEQLLDEFAKDLAQGMEALLAAKKDRGDGELKKQLKSLVQQDQKHGHPSTETAPDLLGSSITPQQPLPPSSSADPEPRKTTHVPQSESKSFQDTIEETMEKLKQSDESAKANKRSDGAGSSEEDDQLAELLEKLMTGEGGLADESQLQSMLQNFMEELMSKEIMYGPLKDMNRLYPQWIASHRGTLEASDLERYRTQSEIVAEVVKKFEDRLWDEEEKAGGEKFAARQKEVVDLLTRMQDCGPPPKEIIGDMPPGMLDEDGLPNPEQCIIS